ncbi:MAG: hypothetical protein MJ148_03570 [Clostridia bacterium]|nr:hypothetical protein [Clostridia bacterium]
MLKQIEAKLNEVKTNLPDNAQFKEWLLNSNLWSWIYSCFLAQGQNVSKPCIVDMTEGKLRDEAPLSCYTFVLAVKDIYMDMQNDISMLSDPSLKLFKRWAKLFGCEDYRQSNPVIFEYGFVPCHFRMIDEELDEAFRKYASSREDGIKASADLFLDIIKAFPYDEETVDMAFVVLMYCLLEHGYPLPELGLTERDFNAMISECMKEKDYSNFYSLLGRNIYNRLDAILLIEKQANEIL